VIEPRVTVCYRAGGLPLWLPVFRLASVVRPGGGCLWRSEGYLAAPAT
jgi:hypothetical protein